ncbi:MAG: hypothetical protein J6Y97_01000 [Prevotella sp.]|nr:hypothetical protein [Prevotella sp.]MBP5507610.1 hypothetical protein [Prevotella sp.]
MRTNIFFMAALMCFMVSTVCLAGDRVISPNQLPNAAKLFIQKKFKGQRIVYAEIDYDYGRKKYEVKLTNGVELKFDARGNCYKIDYDDDYYRVGVTYPKGQSRVRIQYDDDDDDYYDD